MAPAPKGKGKNGKGAGAAVAEAGEEPSGPEVPCARSITLRMLLCHCSGLGYAPSKERGPPRTPVHAAYLKLVDAAEAKDVATLGAWTDALAKIPLLFQPGQRHQYGYSHDVMGRVLEVVTGESLDVVLQHTTRINDCTRVTHTRERESTTRIMYFTCVTRVRRPKKMKPTGS